jgi:hypothetical protein
MVPVTSTTKWPDLRQSNCEVTCHKKRQNQEELSGERGGLLNAVPEQSAPVGHVT